MRNIENDRNESPGFKSQSISLESMTHDGHHFKKHSLSVQQFKSFAYDELVYQNRDDFGGENQINQFTPKFKENKNEFNSNYDKFHQSLSKNEIKQKIEHFREKKEESWRNLRILLDEKILIDLIEDLFKMFIVFL